jgi:tripartite-type tricarboxylate transporter receptor subunit TctC
MVSVGAKCQRNFGRRDSMGESTRVLPPRAACLSAAVALSLVAPPSAAEDFFAGKQIEVIVGSAVGGGYDAYARFLARHMGRFIPGTPTFVVKNMPGAGGRIAASYLATRAPRDGTSFGIFQNTLTLDQLAKTPNSNFDMRRFSWIGNMNVQSTMCVLARHVQLASTRTLLEKEFIVGGTNAGSSISIIPFILNSLVGTKFKIVQGYSGSSTILLAMERREMDGMCGWGWDSARVQALQLIDRNAITLALDIGNEPHPELKARGVPFVMDMLSDGHNRRALHLLLSPQEYGRPFGAPAGIPADRLATLRTALRQTLEDKAFLADAEKAQLEIRYGPPEHIKSAIEAAFDAPAAVQDHAIGVLRNASR